MRYAIWYHLYNLKNVKNTHEGVLLLIKLQAKRLQLKVTLLHGCFSHFLNCTNDTKSRKTAHMKIGKPSSGKMKPRSQIFESSSNNDELLKTMQKYLISLVQN